MCNIINAVKAPISTNDTNVGNPLALLAAIITKHKLNRAANKIAIVGTPLFWLTLAKKGGKRLSRPILNKRRLAAACPTIAANDAPIAFIKLNAHPNHKFIS